MELKKWSFDLDYRCFIVFAENLEEALNIINREYWEDEELFTTFDDYDIEELEIQNPDKAYKGYYVKEDEFWYAY